MPLLLNCAMSARFTSLLTLCTLLTITTAAAAGDDTRDVVTTKSGRQIPLSLLNARLAAAQQPANAFADAAHHVYELTADNLLSSPIHTIDLTKLTTVDDVPAAPSTVHVVNGRRLPAFPVVASIRSGDGYTALHYGDDAELLSLSGHGLDLMPLHADHPGIYFARRVSRGALADADGDGEEEVPMKNEESSDEVVESALMTEMGPPEMANMTVENDKPPSSCKDGIPHYVEIGITFDNTLCRFHNHDAKRTIMAIHAMFSAASRPFLLDTCVRLALVHIDGHCRDPNDPYAAYTEQISFSIVPAFLAEWQKPERRAVKRDLLYLLTGFNDGTTTLGFAFPGTWGGLCDPERAFGWVEGIIPGVFAHNLGRNLGASTTENGLMNAFYSPGPIPRLAASSRKEIVDFIDTNVFAECLSTTPPVKPLAPIVTSVPPRVVLPEYGTCAVSRQSGQVLECSRKRHVVGKIRSRLAGDLLVIAYQEYGNFHMTVRGRTANITIEKFRGLQNMNGTLTTQTVALLDDFKPKRIVKLVRRSVNLRWPRPALTCCNFPVYLYANVKWCRQRAGRPRRCASAFRRFKRKVECRDVCFGKSGRVAPMSESRRCPACVGGRGGRGSGRKK